MFITFLQNELVK